MKYLSRKLLALALVSAASFLTSCVTKEVPLADGSALKGKTVVRTTRDSPGLVAMTPGKAAVGAFGAIGGAIAHASMVSAGNEIIIKNGVQDPAKGISKDLTEGVSKRYGMKSAGEKFVAASKPEEIAKACLGADYALDVRTTQWGFAYFPGLLRTYRVIYGSDLRLIDCRSGKVVASGAFLRDPQEEEHCYSHDAIVENGAANLKKELKIAEQSAKSHFKGSILKY